MEVSHAGSTSHARTVVLEECFSINLRRWLARLPLVIAASIVFGLILHWLKVASLSLGVILGLVISSQRLFERQSLIISNTDIRVIGKPWFWAAGRSRREKDKLRGRVNDVERWSLDQVNGAGALSIWLGSGTVYNISYNPRLIDRDDLLRTLSSWFRVPPE